MTRALALFLLLFGCDTVKRCKDNSVLVDVTLEKDAAAANRFSVMVSDGAKQLTAMSSRAGGAATGTLEIDFGAGYPRGDSITLTLSAMQDGRVLATGTATATLSASCARLSIDVGTPPPPNDLSVPADLAEDVATKYVDPTLGSDDAAHGDAPGAGAYQSLTYALSKAQRDVVLAQTTYSPATGESLPFVLTGEQTLNCQLTNNGARAVLSGAAPLGPNQVTVALTGSANALMGCEVVVTGNHGIEITRPASASRNHVVGRCYLHSATGTGMGVVVAATADFVTIQNSNFENLTTGISWNSAGVTSGLMLRNSFSGIGANDVSCVAALPGVTGSANSDDSNPDLGGAAASCVMCMGCPFR